MLTRNPTCQRSTATLIENHYVELASLANHLLERYRGHECFSDPCELLNDACLFFLSHSYDGWNSLGHFRANIYLKMRNLLHDQQRVQKQRPMSLDFTRDYRIAYPLPMRSFTQRSDLRMDLLEACSTLSRFERLSFLLKIREELSLDEVALLLDCSRRHISRILQRVLPVIREYLRR